MKKIVKKKTSTKTKEKNQQSDLNMLLSNRIKGRLEVKNVSYIELAKAIGITSSSLYRAIKRGTITMVMLEAIATFLEVHPLYLLESDIIERMAEEIMKHKENPDLKSFMFGLSRDVAKGMKLEEATYKNMAPESYKNGLML